MEQVTLKMQPDIILLEPPSVESERESGLVVVAKDAPRNIATITDIHPETATRIGVNVGDTVLINSLSAREIQLNETTKRLAIYADDILARVEEATDEQ